jgi:methyl-accepting chemotaxis protein
MMETPLKTTQLLQHFRLRNSILLGYSIPVFLSVLTAILVYVQGVRVVEEKSQKVKLLYQNIDEVQGLAFSIAELEKAGRGYLLGQRNSELERYEYWDTELYNRSETIRALIQDPEQQKTLNEIIKVGDRMNELYRRLISYIQLGKPQKVEQIWQAGEVQAITENLGELVARFAANAQNRLAEEQAKEQAALRGLTFLVFGIAGFSGIIAVLAGIGIATAISQQMNRETRAIAGTSVAIATTLEEQERNSAQQAAAVRETATTLDQLGSSLRHAEEQSNHSALGANQALALSEQGQAAVQRTLSGLENLQAKVGEIRQHSNRLTAKSVEIEQITQVVRQLATQTNMLALNATIEAVRAGEQGQGFAVVAAEIRTLADTTKQSAARIEQLIIEIRAEINTSAQATEAGTQTVAEGMEIGQEMAATFDGVADAVQNVAVNNQQLALNAKQQAEAMEQILTAMNDINQAADNNALGVSQLRTGMHQLNIALQNLKALV